MDQDDLFDNTNDEPVASSSSSSSAAASHPINKPVNAYVDMFPSLPTSSGPAVSSTWRPAIVSKPSTPPASSASSKAGSKKSSPASSAPKIKIETSIRVVLPKAELDTKVENHSSVLKYIATSTETQIESQTNRDGSILVIIGGKQADVISAKQKVAHRLLAQHELNISLPKEYHKFLIGTAGKIRQEIEAKTNAFVNIPKAEDELDQIKLTGDKNAIRAAQMAIFNIVQEKTDVATETLAIDKIYHVFIQNADSLKQLQDSSSVKIHFSNHNEVVVSGKRKEVADAVALIGEIYADKKNNTKSVSIMVKKKQHRFVIGLKGANIQEILKATGSAIFVPPPEDPSENITIVGTDADMVKALQMVMEKANSVTFDEIPIGNPLYQRFLGSRGYLKLQEFQKDTKLQISFYNNAIEIQSPVKEEVTKARQLVNEYLKALKSFIFEEIEVPAELRKFVIGKNGANIKKHKTDHDVDVIVPSQEDEVTEGASDKVLLVGSKADKIKVVKDIIAATVKEMANFVTENLAVESKYHGSIIGPKGATIKKISEKYETVSIKLTEENLVVIRGPKADAEAVTKEIKAIVEEAKQFAALNSFVEEITVESKHMKYLTGFFKQIVANYAVKIDVEEIKSAAPAAAAAATAEKTDKADGKSKKGGDKAAKTDKAEKSTPASSKEKVIIRGTKKGSADAKKDFLAKLQEVIEGGGFVSEDLSIDSKYHSALIGPKGQYVTSLMERHNVHVKFPPADAPTNVVVIKGLQTSVNKAKGEIFELLQYEIDRKYTEDVAVPAGAISELFDGKSKTQTLYKLSQTSNVRVDLASDKPNTVRITGPKENVKEFIPQLLTLAKTLAARVSEEVSVDKKFYPGLIGKKGAKVQEIMEKHNNVTIRFLEEKNIVLFQGPAQDVAGAKAEVLALVEAATKTLVAQAQITVPLSKANQGALKEFLKSLSWSHKIRIGYPKEGDDQDAILLIGEAENIEKVAELISTATVETIVVPASQRGKLLGGGHVKDISSKNSVHIQFPPPSSDEPVKIAGGQQHVAAAKAALAALIADEGSAEAGDRVKEDLEIDVSIHGAIIGKGGSTITNIMNQTGARVDLVKGSNKVTIKGKQAQVDAAKDLILAIVDKQSSSVTIKVRVAKSFYPAIIGKGGSKLKQLKNDFNVSVKVPENGTSSDQIEITGEKDDVEAAKEEILAIVNEKLEEGEIAETPTPVKQASHAPSHKAHKQQPDFDAGFFAPPPTAGSSTVRPTGVWGAGKVFN